MNKRILDAQANARHLMAIGDIVREAAYACREAKQTLLAWGIDCDPSTPKGSDEPRVIAPAIREVKALLQPYFPEIDVTTPRGTDNPNVIPGEIAAIQQYVNPDTWFYRQLGPSPGRQENP